MARTDLALAALATSAVPDLEVTAVSPAGPGEDDDAYDTALLRDAGGGELVVRAPRDSTAEAELGAELVALDALTPGIRARLPFDVPSLRGQTPAGATRVVVFDRLPGEPVSLAGLGPGEGVATSIGYALGMLHGLPTSFIAHAGLPTLTASDCRRRAEELIESAADTGLLPVSLQQRWREALDDASLWQFEPTVVHGSLSAGAFRADGETVTAVVGWSALKVADPASDLQWLTGARRGVLVSALSTYAQARGVAIDDELTRRAALHAELELARWLLHGRRLRRPDIVDDAVALLDGLVDRVQRGGEPLTAGTGPILAVAEVESLLSDTPGACAAPGRSEGLTPVDELEERAEHEEPSDDALDETGAPLGEFRAEAFLDEDDEPTTD